MNYSISRSGRVTHIKIVAVALVASIAVVMVGFNARTTETTAAWESSRVVVKAEKPTIYAGQDGSATR